MRKLRNLLAASCLLLLIAVSCESPAGTGGDSNANPFTGVWLSTVSPTESYQYTYNSDMSFEYVWVMSNGDVTKYRGTYSYDSAALSYHETVTGQNYNNAGWVDGGWETDYSYTITGTSLDFDDGGTYTPHFARSNS